MNLKKILVLTVVILCSCKGIEKNISIDDIKNQLVDKIAIDNSIVISLKDNRVAGERYGISTAKIEDGFVYTNDESEEKADEIIVIKAIDKNATLELENAMEREVTNLLSAWEGVDKNEYKKIRKHILKTNGNYVLLAVGDKSKETEKVFDNFF